MRQEEPLSMLVQEECDMSIMIDLPPAMVQEARDYATRSRETLEQMLVQCVAKELARRRKVAAAMAKLDALVEKSHGRLTKPYKFNRADAYPEGEYA